MPDRPQTFQEVLAAAVADLAENGFTDMERVERWSRLIREAAVRSMIRPESLDQQLRDGLASIYRKMVERDGLLRYNPGIERFTYEQIKPRLRGELDRRIMASANLIKLNREQAVDKTIQRFQGWATSIPPGGIAGETRAEVKANVRKSLAQLPFEERRVLIDQGHKLIGAINEIVASDGGAIAGRWRSHWRQPGYNYREDHKERDEKVYLIRDSWAHRAGFVKKGRVGYVDDVTAPAQEPFCRCYYVFLYGLRDLPEDMLTAKGKAGLTQAAEHNAMQRSGARTDSADDVSHETVTPKVGYEAHRMRLGRLRALIPAG
jgi:hypothetical protein